MLSTVISLLEQALDEARALIDVPEPSPPNGGNMASIDVFDSGNSSERVTRLDRGNKHVVVYSVPVSVVPGDVLVIGAELECTNDVWEKYGNSKLACEIVVGDSPASVDGWSPAEGNAFNITRNSHHGVATKVAIAKVPSNVSGTKYVNLTAWSSDGLKVEKDYGRIQVLRLRS